MILLTAIYITMVVMYDKGHEVAPMDAVLGWNYVRAFRRLSDGTLKQLA